jgi:hypothetical protein
MEELKQQARRGDPSAANILEYMAQMAAADAGYPEAQAFLAQGLMNGTAHLPAGLAADDNAANLLKVAADWLFSRCSS